MFWKALSLTIHCIEHDDWCKRCYPESCLDLWFSTVRNTLKDLTRELLPQLWY
uniref:Uncharacterized protein n=1 Tax=Anguilla anguilla TaxID=7936 RepID=A0A0E9W5U5_ANGAN